MRRTGVTDTMIEVHRLPGTGVANVKVIIAGGSIAGLAAALTLDCIGHDVEICERSVMSLRGQGGGVAGHAPPRMRLHHKRFTLDAAMLSRPEMSAKTKVRRRALRRTRPISAAGSLARHTAVFER